MWNRIATARRARLASSGVTRAIYATARPTTRALSTTASLSTTREQKTLDRSTLRPERTEYSQSGTDDEVAGHPSAYDPSNTSPEGQTEASGRESQQAGKISNPLDVSPANTEVSQARDPTEGAPDQNVPSGPSVRGSPRKRPVNCISPQRPN
ncbi:hypothetical protein VTN02DRAFT_6830 [Thermoascus thermophilus]